MYGPVREIHDTKNSEIDIKTLDFPFSPRGFLAATDMTYLDNFDIKSDIFVYAKLEHQFLYRRLGWEDDCHFLLPTTGTDVPYSLQTFVRRGIINMVSAVAGVPCSEATVDLSGNKYWKSNDWSRLLNEMIMLTSYQRS